MKIAFRTLLFTGAFLLSIAALGGTTKSVPREILCKARDANRYVLIEIDEASQTLSARYVIDGQIISHATLTDPAGLHFDGDEKRFNVSISPFVKCPAPRTTRACENWNYYPQTISLSYGLTYEPDWTTLTPAFGLQISGYHRGSVDEGMKGVCSLRY